MPNVMLENSVFAIRLLEIYYKDEDYFASFFELIERQGQPSGPEKQLGLFDSFPGAEQALRKVLSQQNDSFASGNTGEIIKC